MVCQAVNTPLRAAQIPGHRCLTGAQGFVGVAFMRPAGAMNRAPTTSGGFRRDRADVPVWVL